jgi:hypothetical protein
LTACQCGTGNLYDLYKSFGADPFIVVDPKDRTSGLPSVAVCRERCDWISGAVSLNFVGYQIDQPNVWLSRLDSTCCALRRSG